jgi:hypothetical protein
MQHDVASNSKHDVAVSSRAAHGCCAWLLQTLAADRQCMCGWPACRQTCLDSLYNSCTFAGIPFIHFASQVDMASVTKLCSSCSQGAQVQVIAHQLSLVKMITLVMGAQSLHALVSLLLRADGM